MFSPTSDGVGAGSGFPRFAPDSGPWRVSPLGVGTGECDVPQERSTRRPKAFEGDFPPPRPRHSSRAPPRPAFGLLIHTFGAQLRSYRNVVPRPKGRGQRVAPEPGSPRAVDRGRYRRWGGDRGGGLPLPARSPAPVPCRKGAVRVDSHGESVPGRGPKTQERRSPRLV
jgi:hypothetical protein